jgi:formylmethanofuran dehydrogenase subunit B
MYQLTEFQIKEIAFRAWLHIDPRATETAKTSFNIFWDRNKDVYLSKSFLKKIEDPIKKISERIKTQRITS